MTRHFIIMSSSYSTGTRIALDFCGDKINESPILQTIDKIKFLCGGDVSLSTHFVTANSKKWESVAESDSFFKDVVLIQSVEEFIKLIKKDLTLSGLDIAKYILTQRTCTHLELQKLVYLCYADYLCKTKKQLFSDYIYAYKYGPVIDSIYKKYKGSGPFEIDLDETQNTVQIDEDSTKAMPAKSRIMFSTNGTEKLLSIEESLHKYTQYTTHELVELTHKKGGPWDRTPQSSSITDDLILRYHKM